MRFDIRPMLLGAQPGAPVHIPLSQRVAALTYGLFCYAIALAVLAYLAGWMGGFLVPRHIDSPREGPLWLALLIDAGLLALFSVQHSVMARPAFKKWWTRIVPPVAERPTYVLLSCVALGAMFALWRPLGGVIWDVQSPGVRAAVYAVYALGWIVLLGATCLINHFDLFGLRQVWLHFRGRACTHLRFATPGPYRYVRHPLYVGWLLTFWATPTMTASHLLFALLTTAYILVAIRYEERDLVRAFPEYAEYRARTGMLTPRFGGGRGAQPVVAPVRM